ncbi:hypothetical protein NYO67_8954 [Aspergillus flavus]|nr:hypothetical protein NYO67_8954 [Aspergillus flavus]
MEIYNPGSRACLHNIPHGDTHQRPGKSKSNGGINLRARNRAPLLQYESGSWQNTSEHMKREQIQARSPTAEGDIVPTPWETGITGWPSYGCQNQLSEREFEGRCLCMKMCKLRQYARRDDV